MIRISLAAATACSMLFATAMPAFAADMGGDAMMAGDAMADDAMMGDDEAMAAECMVKAEMESDEAKMKMMMDECQEMYPDVMMDDGDAM